MKTWLAFTMMACFAAQSHAFGRRCVHTYTPFYRTNYYQPTYAAPQTYCAPTYHEPYCAPKQEYHYPVQKVCAQEIAVAPYIITVPVDTRAVGIEHFGAPYYYSISEAYREKAYLRQMLREELGSLFGGQPPPQLQPPPSYQQQPYPQQPPPNELRQSPVELKQVFGPDLVTPPELQAKVIAAYQGRGACLNCHGADGKASGPRGKEFRLVFQAGPELKLAKLPNAMRWKVHGMASVGKMPPKAVKDLSAAMETQHLPTLLEYAMQEQD